MTERAARDLAKRGGKDLDALRKAASAARLQGRAARHSRRGDAAAALARKTAANVVGEAAGHQRAAGRGLHRALGSFRHRAIRSRASKPDADRIFNGAYDNASGCAGLLEIAQGHGAGAAEAGAVDLLRVHDRRGVGPAGLRVLRRASADADRASGRQHQHRRNQLSRADQGHGAARRPTVDAGPDAGSAR